MKKQIEEMAKDICERWHEGICHEDNKLCDLKCEAWTEARFLYDRGYRKQSEGEWIEHVRIARKNNLPPLYHYQCSLCGVYLAKRANFCPNCGAKMKGADNE